jgi:plasmid maintenance system antidote protein VapI
MPKIYLANIALLCNNVLMGQIRDSILKQMLKLELTIYQVSKKLEGKIPQRTVYTFLTGEKDMGTETASILMETLGLKVEVNTDRTEYLRAERMKKEKPESFRGRVIAEWKKAGKPNWSSRELLAICLLVDFELRTEGLNPAEVFRKHVENRNYSKAMTWAQGLKFKTWK